MRATRYWAIFEELLGELGYRDYLGALQRYRVEHPHDSHLLAMSSYLVDYPFANRLYPGALDVLERLRAVGADGHPVRRRRGVPAAQGRALRPLGGGRRHVLIYIHKEEELDDVERRYPARALRAGRRQAAHPRPR